MRSRRNLTSWLSLLCLVAVASLSSIAYGQSDIEKRVRTMNKQAMADYDSLEFDMARTTLLDAVSLIRQNGLSESPIAAKTYLNLGVVYVAGFKDRNRGLQQFIAALRINPQAHIDPGTATPELDEIFNNAKKQSGGGSAPPSKPAAPVVEKPVDNGNTEVSPDDVKGLAHVAPEEAVANAPLSLKAQLGADTGAARVFIMFRSSGQADYVSIPMTHGTGATWVGVIPGEAVGDRPLQYYLEARDKRGRTIIGSGSAPNPYIVTIAEDAPPRNPTLDSRKAERGEKSKFHHLFLFVMPGFGFGYHPAGNKTEIAYQPTGDGTYKRTAVDKPGGVAIAPFHLAIEAGGLITNHISLSAVGRFEVVTGANAETQPIDGGGTPVGASTKATGAVAGYLRFRYRFLEGKVHPYLTVDIGGGEIRHALNIGNAQQVAKAAPPDGNGVGVVDAASASSAGSNSPILQGVCPKTGTCYDSLKMGYFFVGGGVGVWYDVWKYIGLIADLNVLGAVGVGPGGQAGVNIDIQLGVGAHFL